MASIFSRLKQAVARKKPVQEKPKPTPKPKVISKPKPPKPKLKKQDFSNKRKELFIQAEKEASEIKRRAEFEAQEIKKEIEELRRKLVLRETEIGRQSGVLEGRERVANEQKEEIDKNLKSTKGKLEEIEEIRKKQIARLEKLASLSKEEAKELILKGIEKKLAGEISRRIADAEEEIRSKSEEKAREVLSDAMQRGVTDYVVEYTVSTLKLPDEEMKGRIIGREGRNIRAFERATGVEIELDETNDVYLSSFDSVRREIARRSLEKLIKDRRIRPSRIEEVVERTKQEMDKILFEEGGKLCRQAQVFRLHPDLVRLLGKFKFRFSYGQNVAIHTLEVVKIAAAIASEIGANVNIVRLAGLLHDIGKVMTEEEGTHVELGVSLAKKYGLPAEVVHCIGEHHEDKSFSTIESRIIWIADSISGARPGARYEPHEEYVKRMKEIEEAAIGFKGVKNVYAYQAGRDVRVLVKPDDVSDQELPLLAHKIKEELEEKVAYVGQVKVTCIRESRVTEMTRAK